MKKGDNRIFFYLAFLVLAVLLVYTVSQGELRASAPAEYVYWEEESNASSEPVSSSTESSGGMASKETIGTKLSPGPTGSTPESSGLPQGEKQYLSSESSSAPAVSSEAGSEEEPVASEEPEGETGLININTASRSELCRLNGIGEVLAGRIIEFRENAGGFDSIEQIMEVPGIGEKKFAAIRDDITV